VAEVVDVQQIDVREGTLAERDGTRARAARAIGEVDRDEDALDEAHGRAFDQVACHAQKPHDRGGSTTIGTGR
jgi:hypothetical protein